MRNISRMTAVLVFVFTAVLLANAATTALTAPTAFCNNAPGWLITAINTALAAAGYQPVCQ